MEALLRFYHVLSTVLDTVPTVSHLYNSVAFSQEPAHFIDEETGLEA